MRFLCLLLPLLLAACTTRQDAAPDAADPELNTAAPRDSFWQGPAVTEREQFAKKACDCMKSVMKEAGVHFPTLLSTDPEKMNADRVSMPGHEFEKKYAPALTEIEKLIKLTPDQFPCIDDLSREQAQKNIKPEEVGQISRAQCILMKYL